MKVREDRYELLRKRSDGGWEQLIAGSKEACLKHATEQTRYWYNGEEVVLFKVETNHTPLHRWTGVVSFTEEEL